MDTDRHAHQPGGQGAPSSSRQSRDYISGFANGLKVIQAFSDEAPRLTLGDVAKRTGLTRASARRLLLTLVSQGFAERIEQDKYFVLTPKVLLLGNAYLSSNPMWRFAEPVLEQLVRAIGETCSLSVLDKHDAVYVLRIPVRRVQDRVSTVGSRLPAYCTSMGRMLLAALPGPTLDRYMEEVRLVPYNAATLVDKSRLRSELETIRKEGYAWVAGEVQEGVQGLAVPVFGAQGRPIAALAVSINQPGLDGPAFIRRVLPEVKRAASRLSSSIVMADAERRAK